jgi:hypothetical protein
MICAWMLGSASNRMTAADRRHRQPRLQNGYQKKGAAERGGEQPDATIAKSFHVVGQSDSSIGCGLAVWVASASCRNNRAAIREPQLIQ